ncbi:XdhC family protein [Aneurinibacillus sp. Ricciae_BoGa-3]|uniref:XdhC family protein n=1 Tax=Aneurinibacillus sp. Ricciae_BoGa-3 TaxID=3022697 RepID=UPI0023413501|nr:XdhC family protein [Aneurinibacillus sp. Ricciae_BoGa-3]WCK52347.1 XdhC family protein [Aneurinibacillus sp. Ricciae_BoGa-3]
MKELKMICSAVEKMGIEGKKVAMATVVAVKGSAYRRPGARMVVSEDGESFGMIGGGCFDADIKETALEVIETGIPKLRLYDMADDHVWGLGLGCNGSVYVLVESLTVELGEELLDKLGQCIANRTGLTIEHLFSRPLDFKFDEEHNQISIQRVYQEINSGTDLISQLGDHHLFVESIESAPRLLIFGAGHDVVPVVELASRAGFDVTVVDQRSVFLNNDRFPRAENFIHAHPEEYDTKINLFTNDYALFMSHRIDIDAQAFQYCSQYPLKYFGFLGPKRRAQKIIKEMIQIDEVTLNSIQNRIFAPIGLDLGAETAEEVAHSIVSELLAIKNGRNPIFLREKEGNIHDESREDSHTITQISNDNQHQKRRATDSFVCML